MTHREAERLTKSFEQMSHEGLEWAGPGWYAQRTIPDGLVTEKVSDAANVWTHEVGQAARDASLGTPFYLASPNDL